MSFLPRPTSSEVESTRNRRPAPFTLAKARSPESDADRLLRVLREALAEKTHSPDEIFRAAADLARILTEADATAIALRTNGVVICRARSGEIAPELGAALNVDSGISGECFRSFKVLRCDDTETDNRVDPEVCRFLGIRSIAVAPLGTAKEPFGIFEAFSGQPEAFGEGQIGFLMSLAEIAEEAYRLELKPPLSASAPFAAKAASRPLIRSFNLDHQKQILPLQLCESLRKHWIAGAIVVAVLLLSAAVAWRPWHQSAAHSISNLPPAETPIKATETVDTSPGLQPPAKPSPHTPKEPAATEQTAKVLTAKEPSDQPSAKSVVRNAAEIEAVKEPESARILKSPAGSKSPVSSNFSSANSNPSPAVPAPPPLVAASPASGNELTSVVSAPARLPTLDVKVSQGVTGGDLIRKVAPVYPPEALARRIEGSVTVNASIADDGSIRDVKLIKGDSLLATAAVAAIRQWRYSPTLLNGKATPLRREITVLFKLP